MLICHEDVLNSSDMQFGFKPKSSTTQCTFSVLETIQYYISNRSNVYAILLDESKAFDRVHYVKLFRMLLDNGLCPMVAKLLLFMYINQNVNVRWGHKTSESFGVSNGVKQGGVLSPVLFSVYMDGLLNRLKNTKVGCYVGQIFVGAMAYADDVILLAPTRSAMQTMLNTCSSYAKEFQVLFNPNKSIHILFGQDDPSVISEGFKLDGRIIPNAARGSHLGYIIGNNANEVQINKAIYDFHWRTNVLQAQFKHAQSPTKYALFNTYCMSIYGAPLMEFHGCSIGRLYTTWRKCIRQLIPLPRKTHSVLIPLIFNDPSIKVKLHRRLLKFVHGVMSSKNDVLTMCGQLLLKGSNSVVGNNLNFICHQYHLNKYSLEAISKHEIYQVLKTMNDGEASIEDGTKAHNIADLLYLRDHPHECFLDKCEISNLLMFLCQTNSNLYT